MCLHWGIGHINGVLEELYLDLRFINKQFFIWEPQECHKWQDWGQGQFYKLPESEVVVFQLLIYQHLSATLMKDKCWTEVETWNAYWMSAYPCSDCPSRKYFNRIVQVCTQTWKGTVSLEIDDNLHDDHVQNRNNYAERQGQLTADGAGLNIILYWTLWFCDTLTLYGYLMDES